MMQSRSGPVRGMQGTSWVTWGLFSNSGQTDNERQMPGLIGLAPERHTISRRLGRRSPRCQNVESRNADETTDRIYSTRLQLASSACSWGELVSVYVCMGMQNGDEWIMMFMRCNYVRSTQLLTGRRQAVHITRCEFSLSSAGQSVGGSPQIRFYCLRDSRAL